MYSRRYGKPGFDYYHHNFEMYQTYYLGIILSRGSMTEHCPLVLGQLDSGNCPVSWGEGTMGLFQSF